MDNIVTAIIGVICIFIGISHRKGNISLLHSYHRKRVSEEDKLPFGRMVGLGVIIVGISLILMAVMSFMATAFENPIYNVIGTVVLTVGLVIGLGIIFFAMIKYNKGIF